MYIFGHNIDVTNCRIVFAKPVRQCVSGCVRLVAIHAPLAFATYGDVGKCAGARPIQFGKAYAFQTFPAGTRAVAMAFRVSTIH